MEKRGGFMPRLSRESIISSFLHVMVQGINKEKIFEDNRFKQYYLSLLKKQNQFDIELLVYAIMNNHAHFLIHYQEIDEVSKWMNQVNARFAKFYNNQMQRVGYVFRDRYRSKPIADLNHLYSTISYIHHNPVKDGITKTLEEYKFSSYCDFIQHRKDSKEINLLFGTEKYDELFQTIHQMTSEKNMLKKIGEEEAQKVIHEFMKNNQLETIEKIRKNNQYLIPLVKELREKANYPDSKIASLLEIGKNRIYLIMNQKNR